MLSKYLKQLQEMDFMKRDFYYRSYQITPEGLIGLKIVEIIESLDDILSDTNQRPLSKFKEIIEDIQKEVNRLPIEAL